MSPLCCTGEQELDDNPYLSRSKAYVLSGAIAERRFGNARLLVNFENIGGVKLSNLHRFVRPSPGEGGRRMTDAWAPLNGRVVIGGMRLEF